MNTIITAIKTVFKERIYLITFFVLLPLVFLIFILVPVMVIPGNDIAFQLSIFTFRDYALTIILAAVLSVVLTLQAYIFKRNKSIRTKFIIKSQLKSAGTGAVGSSSGILATIFATASCSSCVAALFGFLGIGSVFFIIENRWLFVLSAIGLMLISLYFTAKNVHRVCDNCA